MGKLSRLGLFQGSGEIVEYIPPRLLWEQMVRGEVSVARFYDETLWVDGRPLDSAKDLPKGRMIFLLPGMLLEGRRVTLRWLKSLGHKLVRPRLTSNKRMAVLAVVVMAVFAAAGTLSKTVAPQGRAEDSKSQLVRIRPIRADLVRLKPEKIVPAPEPGAASATRNKVKHQLQPPISAGRPSSAPSDKNNGKVSKKVQEGLSKIPPEPEPTGSAKHDQMAEEKRERPVSTKPSYLALTGDELDSMEFFLEILDGSIDEFVRNVQGAFVEDQGYVDAQGIPVVSVRDFCFAERLIIFFPEKERGQVLLPTAIVERVLREASHKSPSSLPKRITAFFEVGGNLIDVAVR